MQLSNAEPETVNPVFYKIDFIFEVAGLDTKILQTAVSSAYFSESMPNPLTRSSK